MTEENAVSAAEIDLEALRSKRAWQAVKISDIWPLITAVEALRDRETHLLSNAVEAELKLEAIKCLAIENAADAKDWKRMTEAAEGRVIELAGALERATRALQETADWLADEPEPRMGTVHGIWNDASAARTSLAATPAEALERARARDEVARVAKHYLNHGGFIGTKQLSNALAKLDALAEPKEPGS